MALAARQRCNQKKKPAEGLEDFFCQSGAGLAPRPQPQTPLVTASPLKGSLETGRAEEVAFGPATNNMVYEH
jgi:hypothetical protein